MKNIIKAFITDRLVGWLLIEWYDHPEVALLFAEKELKKLTTKGERK